MDASTLKKNYKVFHHVLVNALVANVTNYFVWFALTFWAYLTTKSIIVTSIIAGSFAVLNMLSAFLFGNIVDHNKKKKVMIWSSV